MFPYVAYNNVFHNFVIDMGLYLAGSDLRVFVDWGNLCLKPVVGEFACAV